MLLDIPGRLLLPQASVRLHAGNKLYSSLAKLSCLFSSVALPKRIYGLGRAGYFLSESLVEIVQDQSCGLDSC